mmetsp:Transcript_1005/g.1810  ORF Transcript_1005/g.1810 Transcript_1005/m.1810 type:complete len:342 (+) Transcript_1005:188-1213(+)
MRILWARSSLYNLTILACFLAGASPVESFHRSVPLGWQDSARQCSLSSSSLSAKPAKKKDRRRIVPGESQGTIPANLKRQVEAKRPPLGHVVPEFTRSKESGGSANPKLRPQGKAREAGLNNPSMLKIFGGTARGRRLDSPSVYLRPMMGKVREAVYSTLISFGLYDQTVAVRHLDLFSGSGSVGLESLSRGARHCTFCDLSPDCCGAISRNIKWCQFDGEDYTTQVVCADVLQLLRDPVSVGIPKGETFNIVTICPPYEEVVYADLLEATAGSPLVTDDTIVLMEYPVELWGDLPHVYNGDQVTMVGIRNRKYGRTVIAMYICNPTGKIENAESRPEEFI